jgi:TetR/AcrR family transcriptional repressor of nem operon
MTTADTILDVAAGLIQSQGYNGFSFQDVADRVGIRKASLHHHFPTKAALGEALIARYRDGARSVLGEPVGANHLETLERFLSLFTSLAAPCERICLIGMLAAEHHSLPEGMQHGMAVLIGEIEGRLANLIEEGRDAAVFRFSGPAPALAAAILAMLEGGLLTARFGDPTARIAEISALVRGLLGLTEEGNQP